MSSRSGENVASSTGSNLAMETGIRNPQEAVTAPEGAPV